MASGGILVSGTGNVAVANGNVIISSGHFTGDGSGLTNLPAGGLTSTVLVANGGTGASTAAGARANLGAAASGVNTDITSLSGVSGTVDLAQTSDSTHGVLTIGGHAFLHAFGNLNNTFLGNLAGGFAETSAGSGLTGVGDHALGSDTSGYYNTAVGYWALKLNTTGSQNSAFGYALSSNTTGGSNSAFGHGALSSNTTANNNSAFGTNSLQLNTTGTYNSAFGTNSLLANTTGNQNSAFGYGSLINSSTAGYNSAFGTSSLQASTAGANNSAFGWGALAATTTGNYNTALGASAGQNNTTGTGITSIGYNAGPDSGSTGLTNATAIGYQAVVSQSNAMVLGGTGGNAVKVGIGTATPAEVLDVVGNIKSSGQFKGDGSQLTNVVALNGVVTTGSYADPSWITSLAASKLTGTIADARLSGTYTGALTFNNASNSFTGSGAGLTSLNASNISSGTLADARLSSNVAKLNGTAAFTAAQTITLGGSGIGLSISGGGTGVNGSGSAYGLSGSSTGGFGVAGSSTDNAGVYGNSTNNNGVVGTSTNGYGVSGSSSTGDGVHGSSSGSGSGVSGVSTDGNGVSGSSSSGFGVYGMTSSSGYGVLGYTANSAGVGGRFIAVTGGTPLVAETPAGTQVAKIDAGGIHAGPGMTGTPLAVASVDVYNPGSGYVAVLEAHSSNVASVSRVSAGVYELDFGVAYDFGTHIVFITPYAQGGVPYVTAWDQTGGSPNHLVVKVFNLSGTLTDASFNVVVFKQ